jgi:hypothetical protein
MRFMMILKASKNSEAGVMPSAELLTAMGHYNQTLINAGVLLDAAGLQASSKGVRVDFRAGKRIVTDGPFAESKELIAGFWMIQVKSKEEAVEWARRCPDPMPGEDGQIELRQVFEAADFSNAPAEVLEQEQRLRQQAGHK